MRTVISSLGMVSSIGRDVVTACASLRAGLSRPSALPYLEVLENEDGEVAPIVGHPIRGLTDGFYLLGLWVVLGHRCLGDLVRYGALPDGSDTHFWQRTGLALVTPWIDEARFTDAELVAPEQIQDGYGRRVLSLLGVPLPSSQMTVLSLGHAGTAMAATWAMQLIEAGRLDRVIVLAVDSYVDTPTLEWLAEHHRVKAPDAPAALMPGEAGACFLLESEAEARARGGRTEAILVGAAAGHEPNHFFSENVNAGVELSNVIGQVLSEGGAFAGDLLADLNGEPWRAYELGCARVRLNGRISDSARLVLPAASLGETGAASGAVAVCVAVRSFARRYSANGEALVVSSSEHGHVGAIRLKRFAASG